MSLCACVLVNISKDKRASFFIGGSATLSQSPCMVVTHKRPPPCTHWQAGGRAGRAEWDKSGWEGHREGSRDIGREGGKEGGRFPHRWMHNQVSWKGHVRRRQPFTERGREVRPEPGRNRCVTLCNPIHVGSAELHVQAGQTGQVSRGRYPKMTVCMSAGSSNNGNTSASFTPTKQQISRCPFTMILHLYNIEVTLYSDVSTPLQRGKYTCTMYLHAHPHG
jgi:hypothetical protein